MGMERQGFVCCLNLKPYTLFISTSEQKKRKLSDGYTTLPAAAARRNSQLSSRPRVTTRVVRSAARRFSAIEKNTEKNNKITKNNL